MRPHLCSDPHVLSQARRKAVRSHRFCKLPRSYATAPLHHCNTASLSTPRGRAFCCPFLACYWLTLQHAAHTNAHKRAHHTPTHTHADTLTLALHMVSHALYTLGAARPAILLQHSACNIFNASNRS